MSAWLDAHREVRLGRRRAVPPGLKPTGRDGLPAESVLRCALAQAIPAAELPGTGVSSVGLRVVSRLCSAAVALVPEEVGPARDDQRPDSGNADQSLFIGQRQRDQGRDRHAAAPG